MLGGQDFDPFGDDEEGPLGLLEQMERYPGQNIRPETSRQQVRQPMGPKVINQKSPSPIKISNESPSMYMTPDSDNFSEGETLENLQAMTPGTRKILDDLLPSAPPAAGIGVGAAGTRPGTKRPAPQLGKKPAEIGKATTNKRGKQPAKKGKAGPSRQGPDNGGGGGDDWDDDNDDARSQVPSDQGDLSEAFNQMSKKERERLRKKNVQSVTHTSTITTVYKARPGYSKHMDWRLPTFEVWKKLNYPPKPTGGIMSKVKRIFKKKKKR